MCCPYAGILSLLHFISTLSQEYGSVKCHRGHDFKQSNAASAMEHDVKSKISETESRILARPCRKLNSSKQQVV